MKATIARILLATFAFVGACLAAVVSFVRVNENRDLEALMGIVVMCALGWFVWEIINDPSNRTE